LSIQRPQLREDLARTLHELAAFGEKRVGTHAGLKAAEYLRARMIACGLDNVQLESFHFPRHDLLRSTLELTVAGTTRDVGYDVFEGSGAGLVSADVVSVGWATEELLRAVDVRAKVALVERNPIYHRSTQYQNVIAAGAAAMLTISAAPANLRQVGSVRRAWEAMGPIPALTVGATDGMILKAALDAKQRVHARIDVAAEITRAVGQNVVGVIPGRSPEQIVFGAHYDTWFAGSTDNGGGIAALLALAARRIDRPRPRYTLVFVAWDGEELALYGGYDYLRRHLVRSRESILAVIDFETPSAHGAQVYGLARSSQAPLGEAIVAAGLNELFAMVIPMDLVPELFGGVIPTDIQGLYRGGTPSMSTAVDSPYYHTAEDTPDKVDLARLEETVTSFDRALDRLLDEPAARFGDRDPALWTAQIVARLGEAALLVDILVRDAQGRPQAGALVEAVLFHDHFFESATRTSRTDGDGRVTISFAAANLILRPGPRFLHVTAGDRWPLVESVLAID